LDLPSKNWNEQQQHEAKAQWHGSATAMLKVLADTECYTEVVLSTIYFLVEGWRLTTIRLGARRRHHGIELGRPGDTPGIFFGPQPNPPAARFGTNKAKGYAAIELRSRPNRDLRPGPAGPIATA